MIRFERIERLPHIILQREPKQAEVRSRQNPSSRVKPRSNRQEHAEQMKELTDEAVSRLVEMRRMLGVDPNSLLVLRLETLDVNQRKALERLNISIVEELKEERDGSTIFRLLVQFPDEQAVSTFKAEHDRYAESVSERTALPHGMRRDLFDALDRVSTVTPEERTGPRLLLEGVPEEEPFYLDVDLWNPGSNSSYLGLISDFRKFVESRGGRVAHDPLRIPSLVLVKVQANWRLLDDLLQYDPVSRVDLPPVPVPEDSFDLLRPIVAPEQLPPVPEDGGLACIVDSGIVAGHPLLRGVVIAEEDFDSGEDTHVDQNGHGTQVGGIVVYGDIAQRIYRNEWLPQVQLCSAKVLRNEENPVNPSNSAAMFPKERRVESQLKKAIEYFHGRHGCRVFNLSIGRGESTYTGGRQLPWTELLDDLARDLDIVIIVSAGNVHNPEIPSAVNSRQFQQKVTQSLKQDGHRLLEPATAALCLTVGAIARRDDPYVRTLGQTRLAASAQGCPSPFTRCGPGVANAVKPEVVAPGGNFAVSEVAGSVRWIKEDPNLGEPALNRNFASEGLFSSVCGTSYAAAHVTHIAARMEAALRGQLHVEPSQNLIRALMVCSAQVSENVKNYVGNKQADLLSVVGYGRPNIDYCWSSRNRIVLLTEDSVPHHEFHVYSLVVPEVFLEEGGKRSISVSLAYDPPARLSRQDYIATSMWLEVFGGLTTEQVVEYRSKYKGDQEPPKAPERNLLKFKPGGQTIRMSTLQKRTWHSNQGTMFRNRQDPNGDSTLHVFVGCRERFQNPLGNNAQRYALVVTLEHENMGINVYQEVRTRVRTRARMSTMA